MQAMEEKIERIPFSTCWYWVGAIDKDGYGFIRDEGKNKKPHRVMYELTKGSLAGVMGCHRCDTPSCINPDHIFPGSNSDNQKDSCRKGRHRSGSVINESIVSEIFADKLSGMAQQGIADKFAISVASVSRILNGRRWL